MAMILGTGWTDSSGKVGSFLQQMRISKTGTFSQHCRLMLRVCCCLHSKSWFKHMTASTPLSQIIKQSLTHKSTHTGIAEYLLLPHFAFRGFQCTAPVSVGMQSADNSNTGHPPGIPVARAGALWARISWGTGRGLLASVWVLAGAP